MMLIIVIILIIMLIDRNSEFKKLLEENRKLREKLEQESELSTLINTLENEKIEEQTNHIEQVCEQNPKEEIEKQQVLSQQFVEQQKINKENKARKQKEQKNISILVTGAICIVLSAIVFLMSTWNAIPNILKTMVLSLVTLVFFGGSYIAKEKFKLEKASQTFFYMAMAYIPICLISISIFKLFGTYLSIFGDGKYIYLMFSSIFVAFIYYYTYIMKNNKYILYGSLLSQVFSVIAFSLIFSNDILAMGINLLLYNILLMLITKKDIFIKIYNVIPAMISLIAISMLGEQNETMIFMLVLLAINFLILEIKNSQKIYSYLFNIFLTVVGVYTIILFSDILGTNISHLFVLSYVLLSYIIENMILLESNRKNLINSLTVVTLSTMGILHIECFVNTNIITPYIISILQILILTITYIKSKSTGKNITSILIPVYFIITGINIISELNGSYHMYIIFAFLTFILSEIFRNRDKLIHLNAFVISHIFIALTYIIVLVNNFDMFINDILYAVLLTGIYVYSYVIEKNILFKYLSYIMSNFVLFTVFEFFAGDSEILYYIPMISTLGIMGIELKCTEWKDKYSDIYLIFSKVISFLFIYSYGINEISVIIAIIFASILILDNIKNKKQMLNILPLTCVIPALFFNYCSTGIKIGIMLFSVIATTGMSLKENKISIFTTFSGIYLFFTSIYTESIYLNEILFICWSVGHLLFMTAEKEKDVFKFLSYLSMLFLYNSMISELGFETYTIFSMLGYVLIAILTFRTILIKYMKNTDILEYLVFGYMYLVALTQYNNEFDGMLFVLLLVIVVITSYIKKYGALFMISIFAILINIFALTREFWFTIPWWVYLLTIGTILIGFAIKNEISDKKSEIKAIDLLKNIKEKIEE